MCLAIAERVSKLRDQRSRSFIIVVYELQYLNIYSYSYSLEGAISCVQMCEYYSGGAKPLHFITQAWKRASGEPDGLVTN